jgi:hypothetical protein
MFLLNCSVVYGKLYIIFLIWFFMKVMCFCFFAVFCFISLVSSDIYYVSPEGSDSSSGGEGDPWKTISYAESRINSGDKVFVRGGVYRENFVIDVPDVVFENYPSEAPVVDGEEVLPGGDWGVLVVIKADGVVFDGFEVRGSTGLGISVEGADDVKILNTEVHDTYRMAVRVYENSDDVVIEDCDFHHGAKKKHYCVNGGGPHANPCEGMYPPTFMSKDTRGLIVRRTKVHDSYNEGLNFDKGTVGGLVEYCEIYGNPRLQLYITCAQDNVARYNLIYGTDFGTGPGIQFNSDHNCANEPSSYGRNNLAYGNLVANTDRNFWIAGYTDRQVFDCEAYNNVFVEGLEYGVKVQDATGGGHIFKNNIIFQEGAVVSSVPQGKMEMDYNLWSRSPGDVSSGGNDPDYGNLNLVKMSGWSSLLGGDLDGGEFALTEGSNAIDSGLDLSFVFDDLVELDESSWGSEFVLKSQDEYGQGWEIGADVFDSDEGSCVLFEDIVLSLDDWKSGEGDISSILRIIEEWRDC